MVCVVSCPAAAQQRTAVPAKADPQAVLTRLLGTEGKPQDWAWLALRATGDKELLPLLEALAKSGDVRLRQFAVACLAEIAGKEAAPALADRLANDSENSIRVDALVALVAAGAQTPDLLRAALASNDEQIRCIAARALVNLNHLDDARPALCALIESKDLPTAAISRMSLLAAGNAEMLEPLRKIFRDPKAEPALVVLLIEQAGEQKIKAAMPLLEDALAASHTDDLMRVRAFRAMSAMDDAIGPRLGKAISDSDNRTFQCLMMRVLAERADAEASLKRLAREKELPGVLARVELARRAEGFAGLADPLAEAMALGHPIVIEYVLDCAKNDVKKNPRASDAYTPALLAFVESVPRDEARMTREHIQAAMAVKWLAELASPRAVEGLKKLAAGRYDAVLRLTATGLYKSDNLALASELAAPLLASAYPDIQQDAALTLGRNGDKRATAMLEAIVADSNSNPALQTSAAWYLLKIQGKTAQAVQELARQVK